MPDFQADKGPDYRPPEEAVGPEALSGLDPFIMQADGKGWLYVPSGLADGPLPTHYEPQDSPVPNALYSQQRSPARMVFSDAHNRYAPEPGDVGARVYPVRGDHISADRAVHRRRNVAAGHRICPSCSPKCSARCHPNWRPSEA